MYLCILIFSFSNTSHTPLLRNIVLNKVRHLSWLADSLWLLVVGSHSVIRIVVRADGHFL
jgi:hypothetical protein